VNGCSSPSIASLIGAAPRRMGEPMEANGCGRGSKAAVGSGAGQSSTIPGPSAVTQNRYTSARLGRNGYLVEDITPQDASEYVHLSDDAVLPHSNLSLAARSFATDYRGSRLKITRGRIAGAQPMRGL
jgi:hypothetical protein